ncbi:MAG: hypothetical protein WAV21_02130 [Minisyncoccia bacterium]
MDFISKNRSVVIGLGAIVIIAVGYLLFSGSAAPAADLTMSNEAASPAELFFVNKASELGTIEFDTTVLSDPRFLALIDMKTVILPETAGRPDPFAPIPGVKK